MRNNSHSLTEKRAKRKKYMYIYIQVYKRGVQKTLFFLHSSVLHPLPSCVLLVRTLKLIKTIIWETHPPPPSWTLLTSAMEPALFEYVTCTAFGQGPTQGLAGWGGGVCSFGGTWWTSAYTVRFIKPHRKLVIHALDYGKVLCNGQFMKL